MAASCNNSGLRLCLHPVHIVILLLFLLVRDAASQTLRNFPDLFNAAKYKPLVTVPATSTCGIPIRSAYCQSSTFPSSVEQCRQGYCEQDCPRRTTLPAHLDLLESVDYGACVTKDTVNVRPNGTAGAFSASFLTGQSCFLRPVSQPTLGANGMMTLTSWIWQNAGNTGTLLEKVTFQGETIFRVRISSSGLFFHYRTGAGPQTIQIVDSIPSSMWTHIALQVYGNTVSFFMNGVGVGFSATDTKSLAGQISDNSGYVRVGQTNAGTDQYVGRIQELRFYAVALTNRDIAEVYSGSLPAVHIQSTCRCPSTHPRVKPMHSRFCIRNGVPDNTGDEMLRLNNNSHPLEYLNDGDSNSIWVSAFLDDTTITVDLKDQYQVFYVVLQFYSPLPKFVTIERRKTNTSAWQQWQLYAEDCAIFGQQNNGPLTKPDSVNCLQFGTFGQLVPYSKGNITFNVLSSEPVTRPGHNDFYNTPALHEFVKATEIRVRLQGHYYIKQPRHNYYGLYEYIVTTRCNCHGHAETCDTSQDQYKCSCSPVSNTEGNKCDRCKPLFNDKPFRAGDQITAYNCKPCQCYNHASACVYNSSLDPFPTDHDRGGGGMCVNCQHNTMGRNCDTCMPRFYREMGKSLYVADVCTACDCQAAGVTNNNLNCAKVGGQCPCKSLVTGRKCDQCKGGYYNLRSSSATGCDACSCNTDGTVQSSQTCHQTTGACTCKANVRNAKCDACQYGFYNLSAMNPEGCVACGCDPLGSLDQYCNTDTGQCRCMANRIGRRCDQCANGFKNFTGGCQACGCNSQGTVPNSYCDKTSGQCVCKAYTTGLLCDQCKDGYYELGGAATEGCKDCGCNPAGTLNGTSLCNKTTGECNCKSNVTGRTCNACLGNSYNLTVYNPEGCDSCDCDPTGTQDGDSKPTSDLACDQNTGQCACLVNRIGRRCETCAPTHKVNPVRGGGCLPCDCHRRGAIPLSPCDPITGQCQCRGGNFGVAGLKCDSCKPGYYGFNRNSGNCTGCNCDSAGSTNTTCQVITGQCQCKQFVEGRRCDTCVAGSSYLEASNPYGCSKAPSQQPQPTHRLLGPTTIQLLWDEPDYPNGVILTYIIFRDGKQIAALAQFARNYNDTGLTPYTEYSYEVEAVNRFGKSRSPPLKVRTPAGTPTGDITLSAYNIGSRTVSFTWNQPKDPNGVITKYILSSTTPSRQSTKKHWEGMALGVSVSNLIPFTNYTFTISACTNGGCLAGPQLAVLTKSAVPAGQRAPNITALSSTSLLLEWEPPEMANGIIIFYEVWMRGTLRPNGRRDPEATRIFLTAGQYNPRPTTAPSENALPPPLTNYTVKGLDAYTEYEFQVLSENSLGKAASSWVVGRTLEEAPLSMPAPLVVPINHTALNVTWQRPTSRQARGRIIQYRLFIYKANNLKDNPFAPPFRHEVIHTNSGLQHFYVVNGLEAFSEHMFHIEACNVKGCVNSTIGKGRTLIAIPSGQGQPKVTGFNATVMEVSWHPPAEPNGPNPGYVIQRTAAAFSYPPPKVELGTRFPGVGYYLFPPETLPQGVSFTGIELWFKTKQENGLLMFATSPGNQEEFIALQLSKGRPWFLFDPQGCVVYVEPTNDAGRNYTDYKWHHVLVRRTGNTGSITVDGLYTGCSALITTTDDEGLPYADNKWHYLKAIRSGKYGRIELDFKYSGVRTSDCATGSVIGRNTGIYVGGLPLGYTVVRNEAEKEDRAKVISTSFSGCMRDVKILQQLYPTERWLSLDWSNKTSHSHAFDNWQGCPRDDQLDWNIWLAARIFPHFLGNGYMITDLAAKFMLPGYNQITVQFSIRTANKNGLLFFIHGGTNNYMYASLVEGNLIFALGTPERKRYIMLVARSDEPLCDGSWISLDLFKQGQLLRIKVQRDGGVLRQKEEGVGSIREIVIFSSPVYLGGVPDHSEGGIFAKNHKLDFMEPFGGCMKDIRLNFRPLEYDQIATLSNVNLDGCPAVALTSASPARCEGAVIHQIYNGTDNATYDHGLKPFTEYIYRVQVYNQAGFNYSEWAQGRTREGAPTGVSAPTSVSAVNGTTISVSWREPTGNTGMLTRYVLRAYDRDNATLPPVETVVNDTAKKTYSSVLIVDAIAYSNYTVRVVACTRGGCTESPTGTNLSMPETAPSGVPAPTADAGGTWLVVKWETPHRPNGIITGYFLYRNGAEVYKGGERRVNITGLQVYTGYGFQVRACTRIGCTAGPIATLITAQLPPTHMDPPQLTVMGTKRIYALWQQPNQLNGVLERYQLYVSTGPNERGYLAYNSSDLYLFYTISNLTAGTKYFIRAAACTGGGCRLSVPSNATTEESAPEGVPTPTITSPGPSQLLVRWQQPRLPNGAITQYKLFMNGIEVFSHASTREYLQENLQPWSLHTFRVVACNRKGCASSNEVQARTQEAPPEGRLVMEAKVEGARDVAVRYQPDTMVPWKANGKVYYDIYFDGIFYKDPKAWDYSIVSDRRSLYRSSNGGMWVTVNNLIPYSQYKVQVNASNTKGFILSPVQLAILPKGSPGGVKAPTLTSPTSTSIQLTWTQPGRSNADQMPQFQIQFRDKKPNTQIQDLFSQPTTATAYVKEGLQPYTEYEFRLVAINAYGSTMSEWVSLTTRQDKPGIVLPPTTTGVTARQVTLSWQPPSKPNGVITGYTIFQNNAFRETVLGNVTTLVADGLTPYTYYVFQVQACTIAGCTKSIESSTIRTLISVPEGIAAPTLISQTPTSVLITWSVPSLPNGILTSYTLERQLQGASAITTVMTFAPADVKRYVDEAVMLTPYTAYRYRITASTGAGKGYGPWAIITTRASRPGGLFPPAVRSVSPSQLNVSWAAPVQPNGRLEYYLVKVGGTRIEIRNINQTSVIVPNLIPYTQYSITITACTEGGCTESSPTVFRTYPFLPEGQKPPVPTAISQTYISILWQDPPRPNGPNIRFELSRKKIREPLNAQAGGFNIWTSLYTGTAKYYEDRGLTLFTTYEYRITVYNNYGQMISQPSPGVTTFGGQPRKPAVVTAAAVDHVSIRVSWVTPDVQDLQGSVESYRLLVNSNRGNQTLTYQAGTNQATVTGLSPNTGYAFFITLIINGGALITSKPAYAVTKDGAPQGINPPQLFVVNDTAIRVTWTNPAQPNGQITAYNIYLDGRKIPTGLTTAGSYVLGNLEPYTIYKIQLEVCTIYTCIKSNVTRGTTAESAPQQVAPPGLSVLSPYSIQISWRAPARPNGIILQYTLHRKYVIPCSEQPKPTVHPDSNKCSYVTCGRLESICGATCYSGPKTCCGGVLYDNKHNYECCGTKYISKKTNANDVCCGERFYARIANYECCGGRYVKVMVGQICCPDGQQDRVDVGTGDSCCGSIPYTLAGAQVCCKGALYDGYMRACCGGQMVSSSEQCCGNSTHGVAYTKEGVRSCCGTRYMETATSVCCKSDAGNYKVHNYSSAAVKLNSNEKCCGLERISNSLSCCNNVGYNPALQTCADVSAMGSGCGSGVVCSLSQTVSAYCNRCDFNRATHICGSVSGAPASSLTAVQAMTNKQAAVVCKAGPEVIYRGMALTYTDMQLSPYRQYEYLVVVSNSAGNTPSNYSTATTAQTRPQEVKPPKATVAESILDRVWLTWEPPGKPNGEILRYILLREGVEIYRGLEKQYMDNNAIQPYRSYSYILRVCTIEGCTDSTAVTVATLQANPEQMYPPTITALSPTVLRLTWTIPGRPNGIITVYRIFQTGLGYLTNTSASITQYDISGLVPYGEYEFLVTACTQVGCSNSSLVKARTQQASPQGVQPPKLIIVSSNVVELYWHVPSKQNGVINSYTIYRRITGTLHSKIYTGGATRLNYTDSGVSPRVQYEYVLQAATAAGATNSSASTVLIPERTPLGIPAPYNLTALGPYSIFVAWGPPSQPGGVIDQYRILINAGAVDELEIGVGLSQERRIDSLQPYSLYRVRIRACSAGVSNGCGTGPAKEVRTHEAGPLQLAAPVLVARGPQVVEVKWKAPLKPNGLILRYLVHRRLRGSTGTGLLVNRVDGKTYSFTNAGAELTPYTEYEYRITAVNSVGELPSSWAPVRTLEDVPLGMSVPTVTAQSAYALAISWQPPQRPNGVISTYTIQYRVTSNDPTVTYPSKNVTVSGLVKSTSVSGLKPFTPYQVRIIAVNSAGSVASTFVEVTTGQAAPSDVPPFTIELITSGRSVILRWAAPGSPNGVIVTYRIYEIGNFNPIYQGLNREFEYRRLQPYTEYTVQLEVCTVVGCGRGKEQKFRTAEIPPSDQAPPTFGDANATHVLLRWSRPVNAYGQIIKYEVMRRNYGYLSGRSKRALSPAKPVYSTTNTGGDSYEHLDSGLNPYTKYDYAIRASNAKGSVLSDWVAVSTKQAAPEGLNPPDVSYIGNRYDALHIEWSVPTKANGILQSYQLKRNNSVPFSFTALDPRKYNDTGLKAFTMYEYVVIACTAGGCATSAATYRRTLESAPYFVAAPTLTAIDATTIKASWTVPAVTNGQISSYRLLMNGVQVYSGLELTHTVQKLTPFIVYRFVLTACTRGGCTNSSAATARPESAPPTGMRAPTLRVTSSTSMEITWLPPTNPNGDITSYELRRDGTLLYSGSGQTYNDYGLSPGQEYSYIVTASNKRGSTSSPAAKAKTYSSSPTGMEPPSLQPVSSTAVRATWRAPAKPNGDIFNYTLYKDQEIVYSGRQFAFTVHGLDFYTRYAFRIQACTLSGCVTSEPAYGSTLEAAPLGQEAPTLRAKMGPTGKHEGVIATWVEPKRTNGNITKYELYRRTYSKPGSLSERVLVFSGLAMKYIDNDPRLQPYTYYQYMLTAHNTVGQVSSPWAEVRTAAAPPSGFSAPLVKDYTATSITIEIKEPTQSNGYIQIYKIYFNNKLDSESRNLLRTSVSALLPYTLYEIRVEACTAGGCTPAPAVTQRTKQANPHGLDAPTFTQVTDTSALATWKNPAAPNGPIRRFELYQRTGCPLPIQPYITSCILGSPQQVFRGMNLSHQVSGLQPYMTYEFQVNVFNDVGGVSYRQWTRIETLAAAPKYVNPPGLSLNGTRVVLHWDRTFRLNGRLQEYILFKDGSKVYSGISTTAAIDRETRDRTHEFYIRLITNKGQVDSVKIIFDPNAPGFIGTTTDGPTKRDPAVIPVYQEVWFIALIAIIALFMLFLLIACCLRTSGRRVPYIRERMPLQPRQRKAAPLAYCIDPYDGSIITTEIPHRPPSQMSHPGSLSKVPLAHAGYVNPVYSQSHHSLSRSRAGSLTDLSHDKLDKMSYKSGKSFNDDDEDPAWDHIPNDSGLYDDEDESQYGSTIGHNTVTKEHIIFHDTHL